MKDQKSQSDKFKEAARELGADVPEEQFDRALRAVASKREKPETQMKKMQRLMGTVPRPKRKPQAT